MNPSLIPPLLALAALLPLAGCDRAFQDPSERSLALADKKFAEQAYPESVLLYEASVDGTLKTAEVHFKLGLIYDEQIKEPISAIHHFQRYLAIAPQGQHAKDAEKFVKEDQLKLAAALGKGATVSQEDAKRLKNANLEMQNKILQLKADLEESNKARAAAYKAMGSIKGLKPEQMQLQKPLIEGVRTYTVGPGDTLASIARKFYKNNARWKTIQDANFGPMEGTAKLKPGMVLMVP